MLYDRTTRQAPTIRLRFCRRRFTYLPIIKRYDRGIGIPPAQHVNTTRVIFGSLFVGLTIFEEIRQKHAKIRSIFFFSYNAKTLSTKNQTIRVHV